MALVDIHVHSLGERCVRGMRGPRLARYLAGTPRTPGDAAERCKKPLQPRHRTTPAGWARRVAGLADRAVLGSDFPNIPYPYEVQFDAIRSWGLDAAAEQAILYDNGARLLQLSR